MLFLVVVMVVLSGVLQLRKDHGGDLLIKVRRKLHHYMGRDHLRDRLIAEHVLALQKRSYQVEADLIGFDGIPPLHDTLESLQACEEIFCGFRVDADLAGVIAYERHEEAIEICRMMVHPGYFRQGIASRLLRFVEDAHAEVRVIRVSTGSRNLPAVRFYQREGFVALEERPVAPGVFLTLFEKRGL